MKKTISLENFTDVVSGKMNLDIVVNEIRHYMSKSPKKLVIEIERKDIIKNTSDIPHTTNERIGGYKTTIYIPIKDFDKSC